MWRERDHQVDCINDPPEDHFYCSPGAIACVEFFEGHWLPTFRTVTHQERSEDVFYGVEKEAAHTTPVVEPSMARYILLGHPHKVVHIDIVVPQWAEVAFATD